MTKPNPSLELYRPLGDRPEAGTISVSSLLSKVAGGKIRLPSFQRGLRWTNDDVVKLFDSIWRGYPAGSLLFWKKKADAAVVAVGSAGINAPEQAEAWWVVDGQQRITALAAALLDLDQGADRRWRIHFDPDLPGFRGGPAPTERSHRVVPGPTLGDMMRLGRWFREHGVDDDDSAIYDAQRRILEYQFPIYVVATDDEQALRGAFARINSSGAKMRADEVFTALLGHDDSDQGALDLPALEEASNVDGFGAPARSDVLKAVLAMSGLDPSRRLQDLASDDLGKLVSKTDAIEALTATVGFLQDDAHIPHVRLLPYPVVFSILARWFHTFPDTREDERAELARWVWRGIASGLHQRAEVSRMRQQVTLIHAEDRRASLAGLLQRVATPSTRLWGLKTFNAKSAHSRVEMLAMLQMGPADPNGPLSLTALTSQDRLAKEIFASIDWKQLEPADVALAKSGANRVLLTDGHTGLHRQLREWSATEDESALASHLIDATTFQALLAHDVPAVLRNRADQVCRVVNDMIRKRCAWDAPDIRPREDYLEHENELEDEDEDEPEANDDLDFDSEEDFDQDHGLTDEKLKSR